MTLEDARALDAADPLEFARARFTLPEEAAILVTELACGLPGCPPIETVVAFWSDAETRHQFKLFKRVEEVLEEDLPPSWMKTALIANEEEAFSCGC